ncbi:MAG: MBL fold metallo-hydrolase [Nitrospirae bacterium]|nr:MBL fold metallo-hydrolase [Nitrospirota bacterium]
MNLIVDTGSPFDMGVILDSLDREGLGVDDIDYVVCTHGHSDHIGNNNLFQGAIFIVSYDISKGDLYTVHDFAHTPYVLDDDLSVVATPGHTAQDVSVVVKTSLGIVAVAGDLFESKEDLEDDSLWRQCSVNQAVQLKHRQSILQIADYIVPGHGTLFKVTRGKI